MLRKTRNEQMFIYCKAETDFLLDAAGREFCMTHQPRLLDQVRNLIRTRHYSLRTEDTYTGWIKRFILFHGKRHPKDMGEKGDRGIFNGPGGQPECAASTQDQAFNALLFLYQEVLGMNFGTLENVSRAKRMFPRP